MFLGSSTSGKKVLWPMDQRHGKLFGAVGVPLDSAHHQSAFLVLSFRLIDFSVYLSCGALVDFASNYRKLNNWSEFVLDMDPINYFNRMVWDLRI